MFSLLSAAGNLGGIVGPVTIGAVAKRYGLSWGMGLLAVAPVVMLVLMSIVLASREGAEG
jgi:nitrate/nitrite transporter NarK